MDPLTATTVALQTASSASALLKGLISVVRGTGKAEALNDVLELQSQLFALSEANGSLAAENRLLREKVEELEKLQKTARVLVANWSAYWLPREGGGLDGPFSLSKWDSERILARCRFIHSKEPFASKGKATLIYRCDLTGELVEVPYEFVSRNLVVPAEELEMMSKKGRSKYKGDVNNPFFDR
ncbi:MAG TPA: hypothetical protein VEH27_12080 [Methylomirabilota bacterium]|nr:hypothetical protein [Methylomirabilota bacterium]